jgi:hypothetical protein
VIITARNAFRLAARLSEALNPILLQLGIPEDLAQREVVEMADATFGPTRNRKLLGSLNDVMYRFSLYLGAHKSASLTDAALWLADTPCGAIGYEFPDRLTRELFGVSRH